MGSSYFASRLCYFVGIALLTLVGGIGCAQYDTQRFTLEIKNESARPITLGLTKNGPPPEVEWESPTERALMDPRNTGIGWGFVVPPGRTVSRDVEGSFAPNVSGFLRIYAGSLSLNEILAISSESRNRLDIRLRPGVSNVVVYDTGPFIDARITQPPPQTSPAKP